MVSKNRSVVDRINMLLSGLTPLHLAAVCGSPNCFKELVKAHADVNVQVSSQ